MRLLVTFALLLTALIHLPAQGIGLHPPAVDWRQLRGEHARIIFPEGYEGRARRVASLIDEMATDYTSGIGEQLYDFDLVLQTPNLTVNGYVGLAPFRSEFFVTPPQSFNRLSGTEWVDLLTIHEFRHVQQNSNERRGLTKLLSYIQGQTGWAVLSSIAVPNWFSEGDAVIAETALTGLGRGRTPAFFGDLRALLDNDIVYTYQKARNGSLKDLVPDHYRYGYGMLTHARERFGNDVWREVLQRGAAYRGPFYPFSRALKRQTGLTTKQLYRQTMADLAARQDSLVATLDIRAGTRVRSDQKIKSDIRDYTFPFHDESGRLLALRTSFRELPALVEVGRNGHRDRVIEYLDPQREPWLAGHGRFAVWTTLSQHPRYTNQNYSDVVVYELRTGRKRVLTDKGHYLSAGLGPNAKRVAAVHYDPLADGPELHLLDSGSGRLLDRLPLPDATTVAWPRFGPDGRTVYFLIQTRGGIGIESWNTETGRRTTLQSPRYEPIDMLNVTPEGELLFSSGRTGIDNVYRLDPDNPRRGEQLTRVATGAYFPTVSGDTLVYAAPTPRGERLHLLALDFPTDPASGVRAQSIFERPQAFAEETRNLPLEVEVKDYPTTNFNNTLGGIKLHSWSFNGSYVNPGLSIFFDNALNTASATLSGFYNINEDRYAGAASVRYGGLPVVVELGGLYGDRNVLIQEDRSDSLRVFRQEFSELSFGPTLSLPLRWITGNFFTGLTPAVGYQYVDLGGAESEGLQPNDFSNLALSLGFSSLRRTARRQVQPRWGVNANLVYDRALGSDAPGERFRLRSSTYAPGLWRTHGLRLDADFQREQTENLYQYRDNFFYARGYVQPLADRVYRLGVNYQLPLLYPDIGALGIAYLKRVRLLGFYDYSRFSIDAFPNAEFTQRSVGGQFYFDVTWLNTQDIPVGVEVAYLLDDDLFAVGEERVNVRLLVTGSF